MTASGTRAALIVAGGSGARFGGAMPKQYRMLGDRPILRHSIETCLASGMVDRVQVMIRPADRADYDRSVAGLAIDAPVDGGATRQESVRRGLEALRLDMADVVLIHDAARPFLSADMISACCDALRKADGAVVAVPVRDTLKRGGDNGHIAATVDRAGIWRAQTPQAFRYGPIMAAHRSVAGRDFTDDAAVAEAAGLATILVEGSDDNMKITTEDDLARAERMLSARREYRTGMGYDVHAFGPGNAVWLGGVNIPHDRGLIGHSDADVALHALTDAILGAIGAGDIGVHFPPSDPQWKGAASSQFLAHAASLVQARAGSIVHLDLTIICERPKIGRHRAAMLQTIGGIVGIDAGRISIKATTTEGLGFTGRGEGIAAQAVATVALPG